MIENKYQSWTIQTTQSLLKSFNETFSKKIKGAECTKRFSKQIFEIA